MRISVFGSSAPKAGDADYLQAYELGKTLALAGYIVLNGGYIGTMEASAKGANEAGGSVVGVVCDEIESWRPVSPNAWITEEQRFPTLKARLNYLIEDCDAALALPGGIGTLGEIVLMWNQMQVQAIPTVPLILIGAGWQATMQAFFEGQSRHIRQTFRELLQFAPDIQQAVTLLKHA